MRVSVQNLDTVMGRKRLTLLTALFRIMSLVPSPMSYINKHRKYVCHQVLYIIHLHRRHTLCNGHILSKGVIELWFCSLNRKGVSKASTQTPLATPQIPL